MSTPTLSPEQKKLLKALGLEALIPAGKRGRKTPKANSFFANVIASRQVCPRCKRTFTPKSSGFEHHARPVKPGSKQLSREICA